MQIIFSKKAWEQFQFWVREDRDIAQKIITLINEVMRNPFKGLGKPEPLRNELKGYWSRRITHEHRLVYKVEGTGADRKVIVVMCRFHY
jgi:toxin YoeB